MNGRALNQSPSGDGRAADGVATKHELDDVVRGLEKIPRADRTRELGNLIDSYYLTVDQVGVLLAEIPRPDHRRALDIVACSVVDPQHASRITDSVGPSDASQAVSILTQKCFAKLPGDRRPAGHPAEKAAPPPGAYRLPGE